MSVATPEREAPRSVPAAAPSRARGLRAVVRRGLRDNRRAPLTWGVSLGAMSALTAPLWPAIEDSMDQLLNSYPPALKDAFDIVDLNSVEAYVDAEMLSLIVPLAMLFGGLALLAAGRLRRAAAVTAVSVGALVAMYVIDLVGKLADPIEPLRAVSAFKYYGSAVGNGIDPLAFAGLALTGALLAAAGALLFERRDVR